MTQPPPDASGKRGSTSNESLWVTLDLVALLNESDHYDQATMALCNELSYHFRCTRVSLGHLKEDHIRLKATSHSNKIEKRMEVVQDLEHVMLEAADQDEEVTWPEPEGSHAITREHERYSKKFSATHLFSLPMRIDNEVHSILTLQRDSQPFAPMEQDALRLIADLVAPRLKTLHRHGRGFLHQWESDSRGWVARFLGAEYTWWKLGSILACIILMFLCFFPWPYRINGDFILKTNALINLPAPFDGFIQKVNVIPGESVLKDSELVRLDTRELILEQSAIRANMQRFRSEAQLAMGQSSVGDMHVATAKAAEMEAELKQVQHKLNRSRIISPFDGVVVEGALREQIGAPVTKGDVMMKVTRLEDLYVQAMISEKDIQEINNQATGTVAFASRPEIKFPIVVELIEPAAFPKDKENVFYVRCRIDAKPADWWRPGMSGIVKVSAGSRSPLFIMTHRLIDFLRLKLWI
ncbi:MAG: HlyD family efflux transporter periplasmic adaptor subunit [Verrucomicrobiota bacterium]